ncbi:hypothetical protein CXB51_035759 [Gossypium anomalum]|uniref:Integrase catalytic domain-containing protein n=1 Tax=Gossypium anomalum TaxID=47600 RepID=A0A8J6CKG1_9ROSI|nr:hypothetical protein CXB51_035759 [Gossypium anomalum]
MSSPEQVTLLALGVSDLEEQLQRLLADFDDIFQVPKGLPPYRLHDHKIRLKNERVVIKIRPYRYPTIQKNEMEKLIWEMLQAGIIQDSNSSFASPIVMVKKKDELLDELSEARVFSKLDLRFGYHQIRMWEPDVHKTAFRTHEGHYEFLVMLFGLTNAPSSFQALMNSVFKPLLRKFVLVFFDDILVTKCCFGTSQIEYLGHVLYAGTISMDKSKIECISSWPVPSSMKELRRFLDLSGYYKRFIKDYRVMAKPLTELLKKNGWNASGIGIGAMLQQQERLVAFFSKALGVRHQALLIYGKEMLAVLLAVCKWHTQRWVAKMLGYDFEVSYKKGINNRVADALSRQPQLEQCQCFQVSQQNQNPMGRSVLEKKRKDCGGKNIAAETKLFHHFHASVMGGIQKCKGETVAFLGLLQPLPIPERAWSVISLDFIEGLPHSNRKNSILVVVDHLTKYGHFLALSHPFTAKDVAQEFLNHVYKLHGMPDAIISNRDRIFLSNFWQELFRQAGTKLLLSTAYHPQTDGQTEWWYNSSFHSSIQLTPYKALYGQSPPQHMPYLAGASSVAVVDRSLQAREAARKLLQFHLKRAKNRMKQFADKHRSERSFQLGAVANTLQLPPGSRIHPTFHVSQLKKHIGSAPAQASLPVVDVHGALQKESVRIVDRRIVKKGTQVVIEVLVEWVDSFSEDATWEPLNSLQARFPQFHP